MATVGFVRTVPVAGLGGPEGMPKPWAAVPPHHPARRRAQHALLARLKGSSALTVGESNGFADRGGIINFIVQENKLHFEINVDAAEQTQLKISSKLLALGTIRKHRSRRASDY